MTAAMARQIAALSFASLVVALHVGACSTAGDVGTCDEDDVDCIMDHFHVYDAAGNELELEDIADELFAYDGGGTPDGGGGGAGSGTGAGGASASLPSFTDVRCVGGCDGSGGFLVTASTYAQVEIDFVDPGGATPPIGFRFRVPAARCASRHIANCNSRGRAIRGARDGKAAGTVKVQLGTKVEPAPSGTHSTPAGAPMVGSGASNSLDFTPGSISWNGAGPPVEKPWTIAPEDKGSNGTTSTSGTCGSCKGNGECQLVKTNHPACANVLCGGDGLCHCCVTVIDGSSGAKSCVACGSASCPAAEGCIGNVCAVLSVGANTCDQPM